MLSSGYINYRLTGEVITDWTEASGSFLMDVKTRNWSEEVIQCLGLDINKLPEIRKSSEVIGKITAEASKITGLAEGTPVVAGAGDMLCMLISSGLTQPGQATDITGTSSIMCVYVDEPVKDARLMNLHHALPGWIPFGISDAGGNSLKWFKDELCKAEILESSEKNQDVYDVLNAKAADTEPGSEGLLFFPSWAKDRFHNKLLENIAACQNSLENSIKLLLFDQQEESNLFAIEELLAETRQLFEDYMHESSSIF